MLSIRQRLSSKCRSGTRAPEGSSRTTAGLSEERIAVAPHVLPWSDPGLGPATRPDHPPPPGTGRPPGDSTWPSSSQRRGLAQSLHTLPPGVPDASSGRCTRVSPPGARLRSRQFAFDPPSADGTRRVFQQSYLPLLLHPCAGCAPDLDSVSRGPSRSGPRSESLGKGKRDITNIDRLLGE